jgi:hypothetical protein
MKMVISVADTFKKVIKPSLASTNMSICYFFEILCFLALKSHYSSRKCQRKGISQNYVFAGLEAMGLELFVSLPAARLPTVTTIKVPEGVDWKAVTVYAMQK